MMGFLYVSDFKLFFMPNSCRDVKEAAYYRIPYGYIFAVTASSNEKKNEGTITVYCKDERVLKFRFEISIQAYRDALRTIRQASLVQSHD